jgi:hypothetical protein
MNAPWGRRTLWETACFDPVTILASVAAIGSLTSAAGSISAGMAQANAAKFDQQVDANNARQAEQAADAQAVVSQQTTDQKLGQQKVAYGASGVDVNTGSPVDVMTSTAAQARLDALNLRYGGRMTARSDLESGQLAAYQGSEAETAGFLGAAGTLLTGAGTVGQDTGYLPYPNSSSGSAQGTSTSSRGP